METWGTKAKIVPAGRFGQPALDGEMVIGKKFPTYRATTIIATYPTLSVVLSALPLIIIMIASLSNYPDLDTSISGFSVSDHPAYRAHDMLRRVRQEWRSAQQSGWFVGTYNGGSVVTEVSPGTAAKAIPRTTPRYRMYLIYEVDFVALQVYLLKTLPPDKLPAANFTAFAEVFQLLSDMLNPWHMTHVRRVEQIAVSATHYRRLCWTNNRKAGYVNPSYPTCAPLGSLATYFFPGFAKTYVLRGNATSGFDADGLNGVLQVPTSSVLKRMLLNENIDWFADRTFSPTSPRTSALRTQITFGWPVNDARGSPISDREYHTYLAGWIQSFTEGVESTFETANHAFIRVRLGGDRVAESFVLARVEEESSWRIPVTLLVTYVLLWLHCRSFVISACALLQLLLTYLASMGLFTFGRTSVPMLSSLIAYVAIAFCCDGAMMFFDTFNHSGIMATSGRSNLLTVEQRVAYTWRKAFGGLFISHVVAAAAFASSTLSPVPAVREFGVLMVILCAVSLFMFATFCPAYVVFHHFYFSKRRRNLQRRKDVLMRLGKRTRNGAFAHFLQHLEVVKRTAGDATYAQLREHDEIVAELERVEEVVRDPRFGVTAEFANAISSAKRKVAAALPSRDGPQYDVEPNESDWECAEIVDRTAAVGRTASTVGLRVEGEEEGGRRPSKTIVVSSGNGRRGETAYRSDRMVPPASLIRVAPQLCFRTAAAMNAVQSTVQHFDECFRQMTAGERSDAPLSNGGSAGGAAPLPTSDDESSIGLRSPNADDHSNNGESSRPNGEDNSANRQRSRRNSNERTVPDEELEFLAIEQNAGVAVGTPAFDAKWREIGVALQIESGDGHGALLMPLVTNLVCHSIDPNSVVYQFALRRAGCATGVSGALFSAGNPNRLSAFGGGAAFSPANNSAQGETESPMQHHRRHQSGFSQDFERPSMNPCVRLQRWWHQRGLIKRQFCCGRFGKRVGETREEKDARILGKKVKHEGYGRLERFFNNTWAPFVHRFRFPLLAVFLAWLIVGSVFTSRIGTDVTPFALLRNDDMPKRYAVALLRFTEDTNCDMCSLYYRAYDEYLPLDPVTVEKCQAQGYASQMSVSLDRCGVCLGLDTCLDCRGVPDGDWSIDSCGVCAAPGSPAFNSCQTCSNPTYSKANPWRCTACASALGPSHLGWAGFACGTRCDETVCSPGNGVCNPVTGACDCHLDFERGFFADDPGVVRSTGRRCTACFSGFYDPSGPTQNTSIPQARCTVECTSPSTGCACVNGRCANCADWLYGVNCARLLPGWCRNGGAFNSDTSRCNCPSNLDPASFCQYSNVCERRGSVVEMAPALQIATTCRFCRGHWTGPRCNWCACRNGGECSALGICSCRAGWRGPDCGSCPTTCTLRGTCASVWTPNMYPLDNCIAVFCSTEDAAQGRVCDACARSYTTVEGIPDCLSRETPEACAQLDVTCMYNLTSGSCQYRYRLDVPSSSNLICTNCKGAWGGPQCEICRAPVGANCNSDGRVVGCDGVAVPFETSNVPVLDACGECGGTGKCVDCFGVNGGRAKIDACGVCNGTCIVDTSLSYVVDVQFLFGYSGAVDSYGDLLPSTQLDFDWPTTQLGLNFSCSWLEAQFSSQFAAVRSCIVSDFAAWIVRPEVRQEFSADFRFPSEPRTGVPSMTRMLYTYAKRFSRLTEVGFNTPRIDHTAFRMLWLAARVDKSLTTKERNSAFELRDLYDYFEEVAKDLRKFTNLPVSQSSARWVTMSTELATIAGLKLTFTVGGIALFGIMFIVSCSFAIAFATTLSVAGVVVVVFAILTWSSGSESLTVGPIEQICASLILGIALEHTVHIAEGFLGSLHAAQSHLFARETDRLQSFRGAAVRTGRAVTLSAFTVFIVSMVFIGSSVTVFHRGAMIIMILNFASVISALVFYGAMLCSFGPNKNRRSWLLMVIIAGVCLTIVGIVTLIIYLAGGVRGPKGNKIP